MLPFNRLFQSVFAAATLTVAGFVVADEPVVSNLVVNPDFPSGIAGWIEENHDDLGSDWSTHNAGGGSGSGSFWGKARDGVDLLNGHNTWGTVGWQCINLQPGRAYYLAAHFKGEKSDSGPSGGSGWVYLNDITGESCPTEALFAAFPPSGARSVLHSFDEETETEWTRRGDIFITAPGESKVQLGLHVNRGYIAIDHVDDQYQTTVRFDNIVLGELRPDMALSMSVSDTELDVGEEFDISLTLNSQYNGFNSEVRVFHDDRLKLVSAECDSGSVVDVQQGSDHFFRWFGVAGVANPYQVSCTITAGTRPAYGDVYTLFAQGWCNDCGGDVEISANVDSVALVFIPAPDIAVQQVSLGEFPQPGEEVDLNVSFHNHGAKWASSSVTISGLANGIDFQPSDQGNCANFFQGEDGDVTGAVLLSDGQTIECVLRFVLDDLHAGGEKTFTVLTETAGDYNPANDSASASTRIVNLLVNRSIDGWDGSPGDGICESSSGSDDCSLRAAVMEANALAAATGRRFTVKVPYSPFAYILTRTIGGDVALFGSLSINRSMEIIGLPDANGDLPLLVSSFTSADADRLFRIGNPAGFVRIENLRLQGQDLVPSDTDAHGTDGGLILHQSGELVLRNVTLTKGATSTRGGAIHSGSDDVNGHLTLERVKVYDNEAEHGGGVAFVPESVAFLTVIESEVYNSTASEIGGGVFVLKLDNNALPAAVIERSAVHGNYAALAAGGLFMGDLLYARLDNSTVSGNAAELQGGGIWISGETPLLVNSSTVAFNAAGPDDTEVGQGGGLYVAASSTATLYNSIVSSNTGYEVCTQPIPNLPPICFPRAANCYGSVDSAGYNAMAIDGDCGFNSVASDDNTHVQLEQLADNGGPTPTHAPASLSLIVDAGDPNCLAGPGGDPLTIDQRGATRPHDGDDSGSAQCDRGAYELSDNGRVTVAVDDPALGRVQSSPNGIWCGAGTNDSCSALFVFQAEVTLTVTAANGGEFVGWTGACAGQANPCELVAAGDLQTSALLVLADQPDFLLGCEGDNIVEVPEGGTAQVNCSVESVNGYNQPVSLLCLASETSIDCQPSSESVTPPADGSQNFTVSIDAGQTAPGDYLLLVEGSDGERVRQAGLGLTVVAPVSDSLFSDRFEQ